MASYARGALRSAHEVPRIVVRPYPKANFAHKSEKNSVMSYCRKQKALLLLYGPTELTSVFIGIASFQVVQQKLILKELAQNSAIF
jgi:hypothetical protein